MSATAVQVHDSLTPRCLPASPLLAALERLTDRDYERWPDGRESFKQMMYRARRDGLVSPQTVDRVCIVVLGLNPALVYGDLWWSFDDEPDRERDQHDR